MRLISIILLLLVILVMNCSNKLINIDTGLKITDTGEEIIVNCRNYQLAIDKERALVSFRNEERIRYTSFPLFAQFRSAAYVKEEDLTRKWDVTKEAVTLEYYYDSLPFQKVVIRPSKDAFEIEFGVSYTEQDTGVYLLKNSVAGFEVDSFMRRFSPEPDNYFSLNPVIDIKVERDRQWYFSPAPLNLSFETRIGWFSVGLCKIPDALTYAFMDAGLYIDYPFYKFEASDQYTWLSPIVFTLNENAWNAVADYREYLENHEYIFSTDEDAIPEWWKKPVICTRGEQVVQKTTGNDNNYTLKWVQDYIEKQSEFFEDSSYTIIIDDKWMEVYGDPNPSSRFKNLRKLIDWCHSRGHHVILSWKLWRVETHSHASQLKMCDGEFIDATHYLFEKYMEDCCRTILGSGENELNADGLRLTHMFYVRDPSIATYTNSKLGMGMREQYYLLATLYRTAKKYREDCLIIGSAADPHFKNVQDMVCINDDWDDKLRREKRARILKAAMPDKLILGDSMEMYNTIAIYHYVTSTMYSVPTIYYHSRFEDGVIPEKSKNMIKQLFNIYNTAESNQAEFIDYGAWRCRNNKRVVSESLPQGKGILIYKDDLNATLYSVEDSPIFIIFDDRRVNSVTDEYGNECAVRHRGHGIYEVSGIKAGARYKIRLRRINRIAKS